MSEHPVVIALHGGAGQTRASQMKPSLLAAYRQGLEDALQRGRGILEQGGSAIGAVVAAVTVLEDDPHFNAGTGSVLCHDGSVECSASLMEGHTGRAGGVAGVRGFAHPISVARQVLEHEHTLLFGSSAEGLARARGVPECDPKVLITSHRRRQWEQIHLHEGTLDDFTVDDTPKGTVGAVAMDAKGHLAAATSTGGLLNQLPGRIGDSPVIGAGTWADQQTGALSATGDGDILLRLAFARRVMDLIELKQFAPDDAIQQVLEQVAFAGGDGGCILIDPLGEVHMLHNSPNMLCGSINAVGTMHILI
jgi:L-asparaginase / beta-aspartyl-peptidase